MAFQYPRECLRVSNAREKEEMKKEINLGTKKFVNLQEIFFIDHECKRVNCLKPP
jgi:hypothetical protein